MGQLTSTEKNVYFEPPCFCTSYQKISKWITDLYIFAYHRSIKLLEENIENTVATYKQKIYLLDRTQKSKSHEEKNDELDFEIKNWCSSKDTIKMNRQTTNTCKTFVWQKDIFKIHNDSYNSIIERWTVQPN